MNALFMVTMVIEGIFALGFIFFPGAMLGNFGVVLNDTATTMARLFSVSLFDSMPNRLLRSTMGSTLLRKSITPMI